MIFFFKQNTAYDIRIMDWISDVCSSDLEPDSASLCEPRCRKSLPHRVRDICPGDCRGAGTLDRLPAAGVRRTSVVLARFRWGRDVARRDADRKSVVEGKGGAVRGDFGVRRMYKHKHKHRE